MRWAPHTGPHTGTIAHPHRTDRAYTHIQVNDHVGIILPPEGEEEDIDCDKIGRHGICNPDFEPFG